MAFEGMDTTAYMVLYHFIEKRPIRCWNETGFDRHITGRMVGPDGEWI